MLTLSGFRQRLTHLPRETRDTCFLLMVIAWITLPLVSVIPPWAGAFTAATLLWRGWLAWSGRPLPGHRWLLVMSVAVIAALLLSFHALIGREPGVTLIIMMLSLKTLELRARRDAFVIFFLGFFVLLINFLYSQSMLLAAAMLVGLWGLLTALVNAHRPVGQPRLRDSARTALLLTLVGAPIMAVLFALFPRFAPLWGMPSDEPMGRSGLSASMNLGTITKLALDDGVALRVRFEGAPPPQSRMYFRGPVLSSFDGNTWTSIEGGNEFEGRARNGDGDWKPAGDLQTSGAPIRYEITLEPNHHPWLLALDVTPEPPKISGDNGQQRLRFTRDLQWMTSRPITDLLRYRAEGYLDFRYGENPCAGRDSVPSTHQGACKNALNRFLRLPVGRNPRTVALAQQLREAAHDDLQVIVNLALQRLRTGGYRYTLDPDPTAPDSADQFWFDSKTGFCEHISSAFVVLMRAAGVPSRIVTGFQGGELNTIDGYWVVRNADAHAWAEVWLPHQGWVRVDPTGAVWPPRVSLLQNTWQRLARPEGLTARAVDAISPALLTQMRAVWEAVNNGWNQWVLNYTQTRQLNLLRALGFSAPGVADLIKILAGLLIAAALIGIAWAKWERSQRDPWLRLLGQARTQIARAGIATPSNASITPRALMRCVHASDLLQRQALMDWLLRLEQWRYGAQQKMGLAVLRRELREIGRRVAG